MAAIKQLAAVTRSGTGKGAARSVRREGRVPAVIYGGGVKPEPISVDFKDVNKLIYAGHFLTTIFELEVDGRKERVLPRDYQLDVVTDRPVHVDFLRLTPGSRVRIGVPVHVENREASPGLKKGGAVNLVLHTVEVMAPADAIPESITIDLTGLDFHDSVHVSDLKLPEGCRPVIPQDGSHGRDHRPADRHGRRDACRRGRDRDRRAGRSPPLPPAKAAAPAKGAAAAPPLPPRRQARRQEVRRERPLPVRRESVRRFVARACGRGSIGDPMLVIAGLGNPGARHARNRHNIGFMALEAIAARASHRAVSRALLGACGGRRDRRQARDAARAADLHERIRPQRRRGAALPQARRRRALIVIHDELDLAPGQGPRQGRRRKRRPQRPALDHAPISATTTGACVSASAIPATRRWSTISCSSDFAKAEMGWVEAVCRAVAEAAPLLVEGQDASFQNKDASRHRGRGLRRQGGAVTPSRRLRGMAPLAP